MTSRDEYREAVMNYETREWKIYTFTLEKAQEARPEVRDADLEPCNSDSARARQLGLDSKRFYRDLEILAADRADLLLQGGTWPDELAEEWRGHPEGALIFEVFEENSEVNPDPDQAHLCYHFFVEKNFSHK